MNMEDNAYNKDRIIGDLLLNEGTFQAWRETMSVHINAEHKRDPAFFRKMIEDLKKNMVESYMLAPTFQEKIPLLEQKHEYIPGLGSMSNDITDFLVNLLKMHSNSDMDPGLDIMHTNLMNGFMTMKGGMGWYSIRENIPPMVEHAMHRIGQFILLTKLYSKAIFNIGFRRFFDFNSNKEPLFKYIYNETGTTTYHGQAFLHYMYFSHQFETLIAMAFGDRDLIQSLDFCSNEFNSAQSSSLMSESKNLQKGIRILGCQYMYDRFRPLPYPAVPNPFHNISMLQYKVIRSQIIQSEYIASKEIIKRIDYLKNPKAVIDHNHDYENAVKDLSELSRWTPFCNSHDQSDAKERNLVTLIHTLFSRLKEYISEDDMDMISLSQFIINLFLKDAREKSIEECEQVLQQIPVLYVLFEGISNIVCRSVDELIEQGQKMKQVKPAQCLLYFWSLTNPNGKVIKNQKTKLRNRSRFSFGWEYEIYIRCSEIFHSIMEKTDKGMPSSEELYYQSQLLKAALLTHDNPKDDMQPTPTVMKWVEVRRPQPKPYDRALRRWNRITDLPLRKTYKNEALICPQGQNCFKDHLNVVANRKPRSKRKRREVTHQLDVPANTLNNLPYTRCDRDEPRSKKLEKNKGIPSIRLFGANIQVGILNNLSPSQQKQM